MRKESKNERAGKICGFRPGGISIDFPCELGFKCPKNKNHFLDWSEYKFFIYCENCNLDIPSPICIKSIRKATECYLDIIEELKNAQPQPKKKTNR